MGLPTLRFDRRILQPLRALPKFRPVESGVAQPQNNGLVDRLLPCMAGALFARSSAVGEVFFPSSLRLSIFGVFVFYHT